MQLHALEERLRQAELIPRYRMIREDPMASWLWYEPPERLPADFASTVPELRLSVASAHGAGPGIFPADEAMARWRQVHPPPRIDTTPMNQYAVL